MGCAVSHEQLWSWVDREAPELEEHLVGCVECRQRTDVIRRKVQVIAAGASVVIPDRVGPYKIKRLLGEGGQAVVYEAEQPDLRRSVALKVLKGGRFASERLVKHFRREIEALAHLRHPNIATIYEAGHTDEGLHYFAMELVDGLPLNAYLKDRKPNRDERLELFRAICRAVEHAHRHDVVHRDLKPSNIVVDRDGEPKVLDFGLARWVRDDATSRTGTRTGLIAGTPRYMSPEQARGQPREIDARSDVYSLGVILYELLTDRPPHDITDFTPETLHALYESAPPKPSRVDPSINRELDTIVLKALEKERGRRYPSVRALAEDIRRFHDSEPILARPPSRFYRMRKGLFRHRRGVAFAVVALMLATTLGLTGLRLVERQPYDEGSARMELLTLRRDLLRDHPAEAVVSRARDATRLYQGMPEAVLLRAQAGCLSRVRAMHAASEYLKTELEHDPSQWSYRLLLAEIDRRWKGDGPGEAEIWIREARRRDSADSWYLRSFATLDVGQAIAWSEEAIRLDASHVPALTSLALLSPLAGDVRGALDWATTLENLNHRPSTWIDYKVRLLFSLERFDEALSESNKLLELYPDQTQPRKQRARILRRLKRYADAADDFTTAIELAGRDSPQATWMRYHRGTLNWMLGREDGAIADYTGASRVLGYATYANARLYLIHREAGRSDEARDAMAEARRRAEGNPWLGTILSCLAGELTPAELVDAADGPVQLCEANYYAGEASLLQGRTDAAATWFQACIDTGVASDPAEFWEPMSEFELAEWRLAGLQERSGLAVSDHAVEM